MAEEEGTCGVHRGKDLSQSTSLSRQLSDIIQQQKQQLPMGNSSCPLQQSSKQERVGARGQLAASRSREPFRGWSLMGHIVKRGLQDDGAREPVRGEQELRDRSRQVGSSQVKTGPFE